MNNHSSENTPIVEQLQELIALLKPQQETLKLIQEELYELRKATVAPVLTDAWNFLSSNQLSLEKTLIQLAESESSFARFGDGEFKMMTSVWRGLSFQENSIELVDDLEATIRVPAPNLMVGLPQFMRNDNYLVIWPALWGHLKQLLRSDIPYGNSHVSRPVGFRFLGRERSLSLWRDVWEGKDVRVIAGKGSRFDLAPELFDSARSIDRIDSLPRNAYSDIDRLLDSPVLGNPDIFLIALGPAGTVLASKLAQRGKRALDIGHLSATYAHAFQDAPLPEHTPLHR